MPTKSTNPSPASAPTAQALPRASAPHGKPPFVDRRYTAFCPRPPLLLAPFYSSLPSLTTYPTLDFSLILTFFFSRLLFSTPHRSSLSLFQDGPTTLFSFCVAILSTRSFPLPPFKPHRADFLLCCIGQPGNIPVSVRRALSSRLRRVHPFLSRSEKSNGDPPPRHVLHTADFSTVHPEQIPCPPKPLRPICRPHPPRLLPERRLPTPPRPRPTRARQMETSVPTRTRRPIRLLDGLLERVP